jgi:OOP family OmpA-OmpF porin
VRHAAVRSLLSLSVVALLLPAVGHADDDDKPHDIEGSHDHPAVKRYPGGIITEFKEREFEAFKFPLADAKPGVEPELKVKEVEGKYYDATLVYPKNTSCTQIRRNYENAFKAAGMTVHNGKNFTDRGWSGNNLGWVSGEGKAKGSGGMLYVFASCGESDDVNGYLVIVEQAAMEQKVDVDAGAMAQEIEKSGHIALYGIQFATGKADVTADSAKTLAQIAALLKAKPDWKLRVEGHTDNVGKAKDNLELSKKRAAAVKDFLVKKLGVATARLTSEGFGDAKPLDSNETDAGKARNRRVELSKL